MLLLKKGSVIGSDVSGLCYRVTSARRGLPAETPATHPAGCSENPKRSSLEPRVLEGHDDRDSAKARTGARTAARTHGRSGRTSCNCENTVSVLRETCRPRRA
jgi:hypothetical protein